MEADIVAQFAGSRPAAADQGRVIDWKGAPDGRFEPVCFGCHAIRWPYSPNPNPDPGNFPRLDAKTGHALVTDVSLKRKLRNFVGMAKDKQPLFEIYVKEKAIPNHQHKRAYAGIGREELLAGDDKKRKGGDAVDDVRLWMCRNFFDVRTFGAVMSTGINCGQVQITFGRSLDPIIAQEHAITRMAVATEAQAEKQDGNNRSMGRKHTVPYDLYMAHGFVSAFLAKQTGFSEEDLELLWQALAQMFEHDRLAARGEMSTRGLSVFTM